jgi:hypothetical protein
MKKIKKIYPKKRVFSLFAAYICNEKRFSGRFSGPANRPIG